MTSYTIIALNQTILTIALIFVPLTILSVLNPTNDVWVNIGIVFIFGTPILIRLIVYTIKKL